MRLLLALTLVPASLVWSQTGAPARPKITGVAHIALAVHDIAKSRVYYEDLLGYREPYKLDNADGSLSMTFVKVNERQYIELSPEKTANTDRLMHISIEVEDAEAMRLYLRSKGVKVPDKVGKGRIKNSNFMVSDPDGHLVEIVQYEPDGFTVQAKGKFLDDNPVGPRISQRMSHVGIIVGSLEPAMKFYGGILGFQEIWRGSKDGKVLNWVNMKVPEGNDYIEFMLYDQMPDLKALGTLHHICLEVPDIEKAKAVLEARPARASHTRPMEIRTGVNRKRQMNLFDPDGTRSELMEPRTVDGTPTPPSTAAPPR
jgi:lactoylglutathione lyase